MRSQTSLPPLRAALFCLLPALAATLLALTTVVDLPPPPVCRAEQLPEAGGHKLPKLFDFEHFKSLFGKRYRSLLEELSRKRYFLSRALRAYVSAVNYKFRRSGHYNAVNDMSDKTAAELELMRNKLMEREARTSARRSNAEREQQQQQQEQQQTDEDNLPELIPGDGEDVERELLELLEEHGDEAAFAPLRNEMAASSSASKDARRKKRATDLEAPQVLELRELPLSLLINTGQGDNAADDHTHNSTRRLRQVVRRPASNNPNYTPLELPSFGLTDQQEDVKWWAVGRRNVRPIGEQLAESLEASELGAATAQAPSSFGSSEPLANEVFLDHRERGCLMEPPRQQGNCGACYAFAVTALMEWLLCQKSGKLVPLSEQYMIDCAAGRFNASMAGCQGGSVRGSALFVHNFGLELQRNYPYAGRQGQCPHDEDADLKRTGFIRMELGHAVNVHVNVWPRVLKRAPIYVKARTGDDFIEYAGGVYGGAGCSRDTNHALVLVGHGRLDGQEYWLLRNSFGANWGVRGYWRLAKAATAKCLDENGVAFGTKTGLNYDGVAPRNSNPRNVAQQTKPNNKRRLREYLRDAIPARKKPRLSGRATGGGAHESPASTAAPRLELF